MFIVKSIENITVYNRIAFTPWSVLYSIKMFGDGVLPLENKGVSQISEFGYKGYEIKCRVSPKIGRYERTFSTNWVQSLIQTNFHP